MSWLRKSSYVQMKVKIDQILLLEAEVRLEVEELVAGAVVWHVLLQDLEDVGGLPPDVCVASFS